MSNASTLRERRGISSGSDSIFASPSGSKVCHEWGSTTLTSPVFDLSATSDPRVGYARWFHNTWGDNPMTDTLVVEISNNNGGSWVNLETVGPSGAEVSGGWFVKMFRISDYLAPTAQVRVRFTTSDPPTFPSVVEAAVDAFKIVDYECEPPPELPGDFDGDGDVDLDDFGSFSACYNGSERPPAATCPPGVDADLDGDGDCDLDDFALFAANYTGAL